MELIQITDDALKVSLTREDMEFYDIDFETLDYKNTETRRALWSILDEAKRAFGFEAACDKLYIQAYRSVCGGCELFVRRESEDKTECAVPSLFRFDSIELLLAGCKQLSLCENICESIAYSADDGGYFLEVHGCEHPLALFEIASVLEYKKEYISEHSKPICNDAIRTLSSLK